MSGNSGKIHTALPEGDGCGKRGFHYRYHLMVVLPGNNCIFIFLKAGFQSNNTTTAVRWELLCLWVPHAERLAIKEELCYHVKWGLCPNGSDWLAVGTRTQACTCVAGAEQACSEMSPYFLLPSLLPEISGPWLQVMNACIVTYTSIYSHPSSVLWN